MALSEMLQSKTSTVTFPLEYPFSDRKSAQPCLLRCTAVCTAWQEGQLIKTNCRATWAAQVAEVSLLKGIGPCPAHAAQTQRHCRSAIFSAAGQQVAPPATTLHLLCQGVCRRQPGVNQSNCIESPSSNCFPCWVQAFRWLTPLLGYSDSAALSPVALQGLC